MLNLKDELKRKGLSDVEINKCLEILKRIYICQYIREEGVFQSDFEKHRKEISILLREKLIAKNYWYKHDLFITTERGSVIGKGIVEDIINKENPISKLLGLIPFEALKFIIFDYVAKSLVYPVKSEDEFFWDWREPLLKDSRIWILKSKILTQLEELSICFRTRNYVSTRRGEPREECYVISPEVQNSLSIGWAAKSGLEGRELKNCKLYHFLENVRNVLQSKKDIDIIRKQFYSLMEQVEVTEDEVKEIINEMASKEITTSYYGLLSDNLPFSIKNESKYLICSKERLIKPVIKFLLDERETIEIREEPADKVKERVYLLMRFYWKDEIYKIGKELNIPYFGHFPNYWDIDLYQSTLDISKIISNDLLLQILRDNPPKYGLKLGGFQGRLYTATEKGKVELADSWNNVRKNVQEVLKTWNMKVYGLLQAIINKGGRATYFDLIHEINKVLGYEYIPSFLLPRLKPFKLVFKTGSNKYPDWTMPPEIIPVVQQEIRAYIKAAKEKPTEVITKQEKISQTEARINIELLLLEQRLTKKVEAIVKRMREINFIFKNKFDTGWFKDNNQAILDIMKPCSSEEDFTNRILSLTTIITEVEIKKVNKFLGKKESRGSINILEALLNKINPDYNKKCIKNLRMIQNLRSKKYPVHVDDKKFTEALNYFGFSSFPPDWEELWETVLQKYFESLEGLKSIFESKDIRDTLNV